ncbi:MAG: hypothetical protein WC312_03915 [Candidatus Omnitrophota bacterium]|jgi:preprotein translocase subunit SecG
MEDIRGGLFFLIILSAFFGGLWGYCFKKNNITAEIFKLILFLILLWMLYSINLNYFMRYIHKCGEYEKELNEVNTAWLKNKIQINNLLNEHKQLKRYVE